jgi:hypothetical protein
LGADTRFQLFPDKSSPAILRQNNKVASRLEGFMNLLRAVLVLLLSMITAGCANPAPARQLLSVTITPDSGTAQGTPGQIQYVATGTYNTAPFTVTPLQADWGVMSFPDSIATTTQSGLATCTKGSSGTTTIEAWVMVPPGSHAICNVIDSAGRPGCDNIGAAAQLTCP